MAIVSESYKEQYKNDGYIVIKDVIPYDMIASLYKAMVQIFKKYNPDAPANLLEGKPWENPTFHELMARFRDERPTYFSHMYDSMQTNVMLWRIGVHEKASQIAAELMGDDSTGLTFTDILLRMDASGDTKNKLDWHQDSSYFRQNNYGNNGCVCSVSMRDLKPGMGPLVILPGSHTIGRIEISGDVDDKDRYSSIKSQQYAVPQEYVDKFKDKEMQVIAKSGDAMFMNFDLIHRSGTNTSGTFRFSAIARYHRMLTKDFVPGRLVYNFNKNHSSIKI